MKKLMIVLMGSLFIMSPAYADEFDASLKQATELKSKGQYSKAIEELSWAQDELRKLHVEKLKSFLPKEVNGTTGVDGPANTALGFMVIEKNFNGNGKSYKVSIVGSAGPGSAGQGLGALAGFAQMAAMMDQSGNTSVARVHGKRATLTKEAGRPKLTLTLNGGTMLNVESLNQNGTDEELTAFANAVDVNGLDAYLAPN